MLADAIHYLKLSFTKRLHSRGSSAQVCAQGTRASLGHPAIILLIIVAGLTSCTRKMDKDLIVAAGNGDVARVQSLIAQGADVNVNGKFLQDDLTPLNAAVMNQNSEVVRVLIRAHADVNQGDSDNNTPLLWAADRGNVDLTNLLLQAGANPQAKSSIGETPLTVALSKHHSEIYDLLLMNKH